MPKKNQTTNKKKNKIATIWLRLCIIWLILSITTILFFTRGWLGAIMWPISFIILATWFVCRIIWLFPKPSKEYQIQNKQKNKTTTIGIWCSSLWFILFNFESDITFRLWIILSLTWLALGINGLSYSSHKKARITIGLSILTIIFWLISI